MPRSTTSDRTIAQVGVAQDSPINIREIPFLTQPKGIHTSLPPEVMNQDQSWLLENVFINEHGELEARYGTSPMGADATLAIIGHKFCGSGFSQSLCRWLTTKIQQWNPSTSTWVDGTGPALALTQFGSVITTVPWSQVYNLWCGGAGTGSLFTQIYSYDVGSNIWALVAGSPQSSAVAVFGNRAIACGISGNINRIQWSVKNDYTDWAGAGSGFEDLIPGPTRGIGDYILGVFPINDTEALVVRKASIWLMGVTGDVDAPFSFRFLYRLDVKSGASCALGIGGVYLQGDNDMYFITTQGPQSIGDPITNRFLMNPENTIERGTVPTKNYGVYDTYRHSYYVLINNEADTTTATTYVLCYNENYKTWTTYKYPDCICCIEVSNIAINSYGPGLIVSSNFIVQFYTSREVAGTQTDHGPGVTNTNPLTVRVGLAALPKNTPNKRTILHWIKLLFNSKTSLNGPISSSITLYYDSIQGNSSTYATAVITEITRKYQHLSEKINGVIEDNVIIPLISILGFAGCKIVGVLIGVQDSFDEQGHGVGEERITVSGDLRADISGDTRITI